MKDIVYETKKVKKRNLLTDHIKNVSETAGTNLTKLLAREKFKNKSCIPAKTKEKTKKKQKTKLTCWLNCNKDDTF